MQDLGHVSRSEQTLLERLDDGGGDRGATMLAHELGEACEVVVEAAAAAEQPLEVGFGLGAKRQVSRLALTDRAWFGETDRGLGVIGVGELGMVGVVGVVRPS